MNPTDKYQDLEELSVPIPGHARSFVSMVRDGYHTKRGSWKGWQRAIRPLIEGSPVVYFALCTAVGSLMRKGIIPLHGGFLHFRGTSTTGKSTLLQTILSLRADPGDMTWAFDGVNTLKWYTVAAENNFLCLDDLHMCILPDEGAAHSVPASYFHTFNKDDSPRVTIISTSVPPLTQLCRGGVEHAWEIDALQTPLWTIREDQTLWWMDTYLSDLKLNYGHAIERILDSISQQHQVWYDMSIEVLTQLPKDMPGGKKAILVQAYLGNSWLRSNIEHEANFAIYDFLLKQYRKNP